MATLEYAIPKKPEGKPVKSTGWKNMKKTLKDLGYTSEEVDNAFGTIDPKYATDIQMSDVLKGFLNAN